MKRSEFFAEMGKGLLNTIKEISSPFLLEDLKKLDEFTDQIAGIKWHEVGPINSLSSEGVYDFFIMRIPLSIISRNKKFQAFNKICPSCNSMIQWISYEKKFTCMLCDCDYNVQKNEGTLQIKKYPLKIESDTLYVGIH